MKKLSSILDGIEYFGVADDRLIESISYDSRKIKNNSLFIAISGFESDGHNYIKNAIKAGAVAILVDINFDQDCTLFFFLAIIMTFYWKFAAGIGLPRTLSDVGRAGVAWWF